MVLKPLLTLVSLLSTVKSAQEVSQAEAKGKPAGEAPASPSEWKGTQVSKKSMHQINASLVPLVHGKPYLL